jgi:dolichol-phosphate mannosyltransferase
MAMRRAVSAVMRVCNDEDCIADAATALRDALAACTEEFEILLVDDGSTDGTAQRLTVLCEQDRRLRAIRHDTPLGLGACLRDGAAMARFPLVLQTEATARVDLGGLPRMLDEIERHDLVLGYRTRRLDGPGRRLASWAMRRLAATIFGAYVRDVACPVKLYRRKVLKHVPIESVGRFVHVEVIAKANVLGYRIGESALEPLPPQEESRPQAWRQEVGQVWHDAWAMFRSFDLAPAPTARRDAPVQDTE